MKHLTEAIHAVSQVLHPVKLLLFELMMFIWAMWEMWQFLSKMMFHGD